MFLICSQIFNSDSKVLFVRIKYDRNQPHFFYPYIFDLLSTKKPIALEC